MTDFLTLMVRYFALFVFEMFHKIFIVMKSVIFVVSFPGYSMRLMNIVGICFLGMLIKNYFDISDDPVDWSGPYIFILMEGNGIHFWCVGFDIFLC